MKMKKIFKSNLFGKVIVVVAMIAALAADKIKEEQQAEELADKILEKMEAKKNETAVAVEEGKKCVDS
jgi:hypothetical protein